MPGRTKGSVDASTVNAVSDQLAAIVREYRLSRKLLVIPQFRESSVRRASAIRRRFAVAPTLSFDGIGSARAKRAGYRALAEPGQFSGMCLFYRLDDGLMSPSSVVALRPEPDYVLYQ